MRNWLSYLVLFCASFSVSLQAGVCSTAHNGKTPADRKLVKKVEKHLNNIPAAHQVKVTIKEGIVGLCGTVASDDEKKHIEEQTKQVEGVSQVNSIISVEPDNL
jgi:osmotically-inducible protein OsmY